MKTKRNKRHFDTSHLSPLQRQITLKGATEPPFANEYWNNHEKGIYVDVINGTPLFSSLDKFESGCGWPSFSKPIENKNIKEKLDMSHGMIRTEVKSHITDAHLGHVFTDGPAAFGGLRYCINSSALKFIPFNQLDVQGYGQYKKLFIDTENGVKNKL
jgi:methionine-R-sulfoxide reductase